MEWKKDRIGSSVRGENPTVLAKMKSGFAQFGETQFLPGYCVLLAYPQVGCLNDLDICQRADFLIDMSLLGDAITSVYQPLRINYDILGNTDPYLHAHVFPRYVWEEERRKRPVWLYPDEILYDKKKQFDEIEHGEIKNKLSKTLLGLMEKFY
jgi:diadenosine tetraphosphate (Ap4A) HIT family hydrolase